MLDDEQALLHSTATDFARTRLPVAHLRQLRDTSDPTGFDRAAWHEMAGLGWTGMLIPEALGGNGFGYFGLGLVLEALGRTLAASPMFSTVVLSGSALLMAETPGRTADLLSKIASGDVVVAFACDEGAVHHPWQVTTTAAKGSAGGYVLNGRKRFVADGHVADQLLVVARSDGAPGDRKGLSLFIVDANAAGVRRHRLHMVDSRNVADLEFDQVAIAAESRLGAEGAAADLVERVLDRGRILLAAEMYGMAQEAFETTLAYLKQRSQFGVPIGSFQALKHRAVHMFMEIELSKSVVYEALSALDESREADVPRLAALCKARLNDTLTLVTNESIQMHGGIGVTDEIDVGLYLKRARVAQSMLGNSAFQRDRYAAVRGY